MMVSFFTTIILCLAGKALGTIKAKIICKINLLNEQAYYLWKKKFCLEISFSMFIFWILFKKNLTPLTSVVKLKLYS